MPRAARRRGSWPAEALALAALAGIVALFFWPVLVGGQWLPRGGGDLASFLYPMYRFVAQSLRSGILPLWNPHQYAGAPLVADNQSGMFYPPYLVLFAGWPHFPYRALEAMVMLHVWWAGAGVYAMLRLWRGADGVGRPAALFAAIGFMLGDVLITHLGNLNFIAVISWLPFALVGLHRAVEASRPRSALAWTCLAGAALGVGALAGHGQASFLSACYLGAYALYRSISDRRGWPLVLLAGVGGVALGTSAIGVLPALALRSEMLRAGLPAAEAARFSVPWSALVGLIAPGFHGRGADDFWGSWERVEVGYVGVLPLVLAAVAVLSIPPRRIAFPLIAAALFLLVALGPQTPVYRWLVAPLQLPFRAPARFLVLFDLALVTLAAQGFDALCRRPGCIRKWVLVVVTFAVLAALLTTLLLAYRTPELHRHQAVSALAATCALATASLALVWLRFRMRASRAAFASAAIGLLVVDLVCLGSLVEVQVEDPTAGFRRAVASSYLQAHAGLDRIDSATDLWQPGAAQMLGLYAINGVYNPLQLGIYTYYMDGLRQRGTTPYDLLGSRYIVAAKGQPPADRPDIRLAFDSDPDVDIWENGGHLPRISLVTGARIIGDEAEAYAALHDDGFDPRRELVLLAGSARPARATSGRLDLIDYDTNAVSVSLWTPSGAYLLLTDVYCTGWRAAIDGQAVPVLRADFAFRAIDVPAGRHVVRMWFEPPVWRASVALGLTSWLIVIVGALRASRLTLPGAGRLG